MQGEKDLRLLKIYNLVCSIETTTKLDGLLGKGCIVPGDFNLHHPTWSGDDAVQDALNELTDLTDLTDLDLWLAPVMRQAIRLL